MVQGDQSDIEGPPPSEDPLDYWSEALQTAIREHGWYVWKRRLAFLTLAAMVVLPLLAVKGIGSQFWFMFFLFGGGAAAKAAMNKGYQATWQLAELEDPRAINVLATAAVSAERDTREIATLGLKRILPQIKANNSSLISNDGMDALVRLLDCHDTGLLLAILYGLEQVGDDRALPAVERLANAFVPPGDLRAMTRGRWHSWLRASNLEWDRVREAAQHCLPYLQARAEQKRNAQTLLRAAQEPAELEHTLLRPAASTETQDEQLLRPAL